MQLNAAQVHNPCQPGGIIDDQFLCCAPRWEGKRDGSEERRMIGRRTLLIKGLGFRSIDEPLQHNRPVSNAIQRARSYRQVVADKINLRELYISREIELVGMGHGHFVAIHGNDFGLVCIFHHALGAIKYLDAHYGPKLLRVSGKSGMNLREIVANGVSRVFGKRMAGNCSYAAPMNRA
jgi:hypothetical protein